MAARAPTPCPRCDYDLSGPIATWTHECPLEGRCPECGLDIRWAECLNPALTYPRWSFEHAQSHLLRRLIQSLTRTLNPWRFWRAIRMEHPIVRRRMLCLVLIWAAAVHLAIGLGRSDAGIAAAFDRAWALVPPRPASNSEIAAGALSWFIWPYRSSPGSWSGSEGLWFPVMISTIALACPLAFAPLGDTLRTRRVRRAHLWRVALYGSSLPLVAVLYTGLLLFAAGLERFDLVTFPDVFPRYSSYQDLSVLAAQLSLLATPLWLFLFWWAACKRYLRLPHAFGVAMAIVMIAALSVLTVFVVVAVNRSFN